MSDGLSESRIVAAVADIALRRVTRKVIAHIQHMPFARMSGDDTELGNTWDEICAQVQFEESIAWEVYEEMLRNTVRGYVEELPAYEQEAIWLQTDAGLDWDMKEESDRDPDPVCIDDIVDYVMREYLYPEAGRWMNARIRAYIDRVSGVD